MQFLAIILIAWGFSAPTFAKTGKAARITRPEVAKPIKTQTPRPNKIKQDAVILARLLENSKKINQLFSTQMSGPIIWEGENKILTGKAYRGILLNSVVSSNLASPVLVKAVPGQGLPYQTRFSCGGTTQNKRVLTLCNKMILPDKEVAITAQILNIDGSAGLLGEYDDGKEDLIAGAVLSDFSQGMMSAAQTRFASPFGEMRDSGAKNQVLQGLINSGGTTSEILLDEMKRAEPIVTINAGTEVLIYFMEATNEI